MLTKMKLPEANAKAIIGYMIISHFICPAIINPEPYGINSDADISETARHNLSQIASILRSLAFLECGVKEDKFKVILEQFEPGIIMGYVTALLVGSENPNDADEISSNAMQCSVLITEHDLKTLIHCLQYLNACNIPSLNREGLGELLDTLPPPPRRWTKDTNIDRNIVSMPPGVDIDINAPVAPPRHMKLKKMKSSSTTDAGSLKELEKLKESLNTFIGEGQPVLIVPLRNESYQAVGMLSEEKVLGLNTNLATPNTFDIEATDEDKRRRASSLMLDALSEFFPKSGELIDFGDLDNISSGSDPFENSDNKTPRTINNQSNSPLITSQKNFQQNFEKTGLHNVPVDNLLNLGGEDNHNVPKLPEKKHKQKETDGVFYDEPLINLENDMFIGSQVKPTSPKRKRESNVSMLGGAGGINAILKSAAVPSPTSVKHNEFQDPWSPSNTSPAADPWAFSNDAKTTSESSEQMFESNFNPTNVRKSSPSSKIRHSIDPRYAEYSETVQRDKKLSTGKMIESDSNEDIGKLSRKKSHGAWLKDKISSKFSTGLQKAKTETLRKSDGHTVNKITSPPKSPIQPGTPMQASEVSKVKSASLISRGSSGEVDISEAILAKYRNMTTNDSSGTSLGDQHFGSPMSSQMEDIATQVQDEVVFDDEFKFDDAKRKLRSVLCTSGETPLPSDTHNFDHLLLTMLQALLAEAINLQNRFAVAQLHETLRSIKQLPGGSCEKLISKLEEDYENRSKYISYMIKCKQGLLSTISTFEQITTKLERDKTICRKYFTTLAVRLFLETEEHKREISHFGQRFVSTKLLDEKCTLLSEFLEQLHTAMLKDSTWSNCDDEEIEELMVATERAIMSKIYKEAFYPNGVFDVENDRIFHEHIKCLAQVITLSHPTLQIPKMYQKEAPWPSAQTELLMVNAYKTAADKLSCIHRCCITIMNLLSMATERPPGADDFVPVLVYVVLRANPPNLLSTKQYVNTFYETRLSGEQYYCWMQFCAAIEFIKTMRAPQK